MEKQNDPEIERENLRKKCADLVVKQIGIQQRFGVLHERKKSILVSAMVNNDEYPDRAKDLKDINEELASLDERFAKVSDELIQARAEFAAKSKRA